MSTDKITEAEVTLPVKGKLTIALDHPTPKWAITIVKVIVWISGGWMAMDLAGKLTEAGIPIDVVEKMGHIMPIVAAGASILSSYLGIKPPDDTSQNDAAVVSSPGAPKSDEVKSD